MFKAFALPLFLLTLQGCSDYLLKNDTKTENSGYFADATDCLQRASRKEQINIPTGSTIGPGGKPISGMTTMDISTTHDAGAFSLCMQYAGHSRPKVNTESYLTVSRACLNESRHAPNLDDAYAQCVRRNRITVESVSDDKKK